MIREVTPTESANLRSVDRELLLAMHGGEWTGVNELVASLGVTATAIRQRLDRLIDRGFIERKKIVAGRGRPSFQYQITASGRRETGGDSTDLAEAMWREFMSIDDPDLRDRLLESIAKRLGNEYASRLDASAPLKERMKLLSQLLAERRVASDVISEGELPVLGINACPYPALADGSVDHMMCRLEEKVLSFALGKTLQLSQCRLDGDSCCQFSPSEQSD
ncbi:MAG: ArsR family transcriptional regulator [Planctomycetota bacterium]